MGSPPGDNVSATEKPEVQEPTSAPKTDKAGVAINERATSGGETLPGWTIMRPLRMRGLKTKGGAAHSNGNANAVDRKGDLKTTQTNVTNGSGNGPGGVGEIEALHEIRSDDELLGSDNEGASPRRVIADD